MKTGDLVRIKRASIGIPFGAIGLLIEKLETYDMTPKDKHLSQKNQCDCWEVQMFGVKQRTRRYMSRDLEAINASR